MSRRTNQLIADDMQSVATFVVRVLQDAGHIAYFAGGCVRDMAMNRTPKDYDVATSATPKQVSALFHRTQKVGAKFGVVLVRLRRQSIEVATFRTDHDYVDGRRPTGVTFSTPEHDAQRRDFTINGMFHDPIAGAMIDHVGGLNDIQARVIRAIGEPDRRFAEDHLRLLRAIRFGARLGFEIESSTWEAIVRHAPEIARISPERVRMELESILSDTGRAVGMEMIRASGLLAHRWPSAGKTAPLIEASLPLLRELPKDASFEWALAAILSGLLPGDAVRAMQALRCSNETIAQARWMIEHQHDFDDSSAVSTARLKRLMAHEQFVGLLALINARLRSSGASRASLEEIRRRADSIAPQDIAPPPLVDGNDLQSLGMKPGPDYKRILDCIYDAQLNGNIRTREEALAMARGISG